MTPRYTYERRHVTWVIWRNRGTSTERVMCEVGSQMDAAMMASIFETLTEDQINRAREAALERFVEEDPPYNPFERKAA